MSRKYKIETVTRELLDEIEAFSGKEGHEWLLAQRFLFFAKEDKK